MADPFMQHVERLRLQDQPWSGEEQLVIAFDIGTTYTGVSFGIFLPGQPPESFSVSGFTTGETVGSFKLPTVVYYRDDGSWTEEATEHAAKKFKLRLCPPSTTPADVLLQGAIEPLPMGKKLLQVYTDFIAYLFHTTQQYATENWPERRGQELWDRLVPSAHFIFAHPNDWEGVQQKRLRTAAVNAGLVPDTFPGRGRIHFVSEGEASMHYILKVRHIRELDAPSGSMGFIVADLGGGTLDFSTYQFTMPRGSPITVAELVEPKCKRQGGEFLTTAATDGFHKILQGSQQFYTKENVEALADYFDKITKRDFDGTRAESLVQLRHAGPFENDPEHSIRRGNLILTCAQMKELYEPVIRLIVSVIREIRQTKKDVRIDSVYLVGGYSASPYLTEQLKTRVGSWGMSVINSDPSTVKAVAHGALAHYANQFVRTRVAKYTYGTKGAVAYDNQNPQHKERKKNRVTWANGLKYIPNAFFPIIRKGDLVDIDQPIEKSFTDPFPESHTGAIMLKMAIMVHAGDIPPKWVDTGDEKDQPRLLFAAQAPYTGPRTMKAGTMGRRHYDVSYKVIIMFGRTEITARITWLDANGETVGSEAEVLYEEMQGNYNADDADDDEGEGILLPEADGGLPPTDNPEPLAVPTVPNNTQKKRGLFTWRKSNK